MRIADLAALLRVGDEAGDASELAELAELGHRVEVFSGQPYPELDGVPLVPVPSLDLYREPDPFRTPRPGEFRDWVDLAEWAVLKPPVRERAERDAVRAF